MDMTLYVDPPCSGTENMARDAWCLEQALASGRPVVRLYGWERLTLSLGRAQKLDGELNLAACQALGIPLVRRATGGRAVLHGADLTYSVSAPFAGTPFKGGIMDVYRTLSDVFLHFLRGLGLQPQVQAYSGRERVALASANCFATPSAFEILIDGRKLVGSAQRLRAAGFLQHGSIPLSPQADTLSRIYVGLTPAQAAHQMTDLGTLGVWRAGQEPALHAGLVAAFETVLDARLLPGAWDAAAQRRVAELAVSYPLHEADALTDLTRTA